MPEAADALLLVVAGFVAGVVNTIAGGGSFLSLPALLLVGLPPAAANATNRVAVALQSASASLVFAKEGKIEGRPLLRVAPPAILGALLGAYLATRLPELAFRRAFGALFLVMAALMLVDRRRLGSERRLPAPLVAALYFAIGVYGGFIQAGVGLLLLVAMGLERGLVEANALKNALVFVYTLVALAWFAWEGQVHWGVGLVLAIGNTAGGVVGARLSLRRGHRLIFGFLIVVMIATGLRLLLG